MWPQLTLPVILQERLESERFCWTHRRLHLAGVGPAKQLPLPAVLAQRQGDETEVQMRHGGTVCMWYEKCKVTSLSRVRLCDPMDCSPPGSSVHGILQARVLEWGAISFSRGSSWPRDRTWVSHTVGRRLGYQGSHMSYKGISKCLLKKQLSLRIGV